MATENTNKTILLVDDDQFLLDLYARKFEMNGFAVVKSGTADEALERLRAGLSPTAIVFDIVMPHTDGYDFLAVMGNQHLAPQAVKVALSNTTDDEGVERAKKLGADAFLSKASNIPSETVDAVLAIMSEKHKEA